MDSVLTLEKLLFKILIIWIKKIQNSHGLVVCAR